MKISKTGVSLIQQYEGLKLNSYLCPAGKWTIGIGSTYINGKPVTKGMECTEDEAYEYLYEHLEDNVYQYIPNINLTQNQFDALCSLIYNIGGLNFSKSTLLKYLRSGNITEASNQFLVWNKVNTKVCNGLVIRRQEEKKLFDTIA